LSIFIDSAYLEIAGMKRFSRLPSIEILEDKRLKTADLAACSHASGTASIEAADPTPSVAISTYELGANNLPQASALSSSLASQETDGSEETETDETETDETETDDSDTDDTDDSSDDNSDDDSGDGDETELTANLTATTGNAGTAKSEFESETEGTTTEKEFSLKVTGATTNNTLITGTQEVRVGGVLVGSITLTNGDGKLEFSSDPDDDETAFPADFPTTIDATTVVAVGPQNTPILTGTFGTSSSLQSLTGANSIPASGSQAPLPADLLVGDSSVPGQGGLISRPVAVSSGETQNLATTNSFDPNLLDAGFAAPVNPLDSWKLAEFQPKGSATDSIADGTIEDALFEVLAEGEVTWIA
jgi:hypothetical protein